MAKRTIENCTLIERMEKGPYWLGIPRQYKNGKCDGYLTDEEPHEICDKCKLCTSYEEED